MWIGGFLSQGRSPFPWSTQVEKDPVRLSGPSDRSPGRSPRIGFQLYSLGFLDIKDFFLISLGILNSAFLGVKI